MKIVPNLLRLADFAIIVVITSSQIICNIFICFQDFLCHAHVLRLMQCCADLCGLKYLVQ